MAALKDTILAKNIKEGCEESFRELYDRYHVQLYYVAKQYVKDPSLAEDAVQDIFVKLWVKRDHIDASKSIKSFVFTMLKNHLLNVLRKKKDKTISYEAVNADLLPRKNVTEDDVIYNEYEKVVNRGIEKLSDRKKEVFKLKSKGHSNLEIADLLKINIRTVKTHYYNSSQFIRAYLKENGGLLGPLIVCSFYTFL